MTQVAIYQIIHTLDGHALHLEAHVDALYRDYKQIYNKNLGLSSQRLRTEIEELIPSSKFSIFIRVELFEDGSTKLSIEEMSIYRGYSLRCIYPVAHPLHYKSPLEECSTTAGEMVAKLAELEARQHGADIALRVDGEVVDRASTSPIVALVDQVIYTSSSTTLSVEHTALLEAAKKINITIIDSYPTLSQLAQANELFFANHHGVTAIRSLNKRHYTSFTARKLAEAMNSITL